MRSIFYPILSANASGAGPAMSSTSWRCLQRSIGLATSAGLRRAEGRCRDWLWFGIEGLFGQRHGGGHPDRGDHVAGADLGAARTRRKKGVKLLSEINMVLAVLLMLFVIFAGPTVTLVSQFLSANIGSYFAEILPLSNPVGRDDDGFRQGLRPRSTGPR